MFAKHVEARLLQEFQVGAHSLIRWGRQQAIRPPTLIQGTQVETDLTVQRHAPVVFSIFLLAHGTDPHIGLDGIQDFSIQQLNL